MTRANPATTPIATSKSAALCRVLDAVPKGYTHYVAGRCLPGKAKQLAAKFHAKYGIGCSPAQRISRKQKGLANALLVMYWPAFVASALAADSESGSAAGLDAGQLADEALVEWLLLVTDGSGPAHEEEALRSLLEGASRLVWLGYELVRQPGRGRASWTWRRTKAEMSDWYALLGSQLAARKPAAVAETLCIISRQPGFSGVRRQSWELVQFARSRGYAGETPFLFHMEKVAHGAPLRLA